MIHYSPVNLVSLILFGVLALISAYALAAGPDSLDFLWNPIELLLGREIGLQACTRYWRLV